MKIKMSERERKLAAALRDVLNCLGDWLEVGDYDDQRKRDYNAITRAKSALEMKKGF